MTEASGIASLVVAARKGDRGAFGELVRIFLPAVISTALSIVRSRENAEDVAQIAFLRAWRSLSTLQASAAFSAWLTTIAKNCARNWLRDHSFQSRMTHDLEAADKPAPEPMDDDLPAPVRKLPDQLREVVLLRYVSALSYEEIALALNEPLTVVRDRLYRAKLALQDLLK
jgi:RNA polymerase sigma-70 factor, ECF subfamily